MQKTSAAHHESILISLPATLGTMILFPRSHVSKELETRNRAMYMLYIKGVSIQQIADRYDVSRQRVSQVIAKYAADGALSDDDSRAMHRVQLEAVKDELVHMFYEPPPVTFDVKGNMLVDENGEPVRDIKLKLETAKTFVNVSESLRKMDATDKPRRKQLPQDEAMRQMEEYLAALPKAEVTHDDDQPLWCEIRHSVMHDPNVIVSHQPEQSH